MKFFEKGDSDKCVVVLHPMLAEHGSVVEIARFMGDGYRYIIPDLSGHGADMDSTFVSVKDEADRLINYLEQQNIFKIDYLIGFSMGALVALEVFSRRPEMVGKVVLEGAPLFNYGPLFRWIAKKSYLNMQKKASSDTALMAAEFAKTFGKATGEKMASDFSKMKPETVANCAIACAKVSFPKIADEHQRKMIFRYGDKEGNYKQGTKITYRHYRDAKFVVERGYDHCELPMKRPERFVKEIME